MEKKPRGGIASGRSLTAMGVRWANRAKALAHWLLDSGLPSATEVQDGYLISATRSGRLARGTVIDIPQMIACPNTLRVPFLDGTAQMESTLFPIGMRDALQPGYSAALPEVSREQWRVSIQVGLFFGGSGGAWAQAALVAISQNTYYATRVGTTSQQHNNVGVPGFFNASNQALQRFVTRGWASAKSISRADAETGAVGVPSLSQTAAVVFGTEYLDTLLPGWVTVLRASNDYTPSEPPGWGNPTWGRSFEISRDADTGAIRYLFLARLFHDDEYAASDNPRSISAAAMVATAEVVPTLVDGEYVHSGQLLSVQAYQPPRDCYFDDPSQACPVTGGVHALLHGRRLESGANIGQNTYIIVSATLSGISYFPVDSDSDITSRRHFYGSASPDGVTSYFLYPYHNDVPPESTTGEMKVITSDGASIDIFDVVTPAQFQQPGWGSITSTGMVCNLGVGKLGFIVTLATIPSVGSIFSEPFDVTFCVYDTLTGTVEQRGQITEATALFDPGYVCSAGGLGAVAVVQRAIQDPNSSPGVVSSEAVLLWSTNSGAAPGVGGTSYVGAAFISYDSGVTWSQVSDTVGDYRGLVFIGNALRPAKPGQAWIEDEAT